VRAVDVGIEEQTRNGGEESEESWMQMMLLQLEKPQYIYTSSKPPLQEKKLRTFAPVHAHPEHSDVHLLFQEWR